MGEGDEAVVEGLVGVARGLARRLGTHGADFDLLQGGGRQIQRAQPVGGGAVDVEGVVDLRIAVAAKEAMSVAGIEGPGDAVGPAFHADAFPEIVGTEQALGDGHAGVYLLALHGEAGGESHEMHGRGDDEAFGHGGQQGPVGTGQEIAGGDGVEDALRLALGVLDAVGIAAEVEGEAGAADDAGVQVAEAVHEFFGVAVLEAAQGLEVADAAHFLDGTLHAGEGRAQAQGHHAVAALDQIGLLVGLFLEQELAHALGGAEVRGSEQIGQQTEELGNFAAQAFAVQEKRGQGFAGAQAFGGFELLGNPAGVAGDLFVEGEVVEVAGPEFRQAASVERQQRQVLEGHGMDVEGEIDV